MRRKTWIVYRRVFHTLEHKKAFIVLSVTLYIIVMFSFTPEPTPPPTTPDPQQTPVPPEGDFVSSRVRMYWSSKSEGPINRPSRRMVKFYELQVPQRRAYLDTVAASESKNYMYLYNNLAPEVYCPELLRVGTTNDGGKWICSPFRVCNIALRHIHSVRPKLIFCRRGTDELRTRMLIRLMPTGVSSTHAAS